MISSEPGLREAAKRLRRARRVVVFSGAGVSAESGIPTFRNDDGLWKRFPAETFATWDGLMRTALARPRQATEFVHAVLAPIAAAEPSAGHRAVAALEKFTEVVVVTQNIDGLHQEAGNAQVFEVHGSLFEVVTGAGRVLRRITRAELRRVVERVDRVRQSTLVLPQTLWAVRKVFGVSQRGMYRPRVVLFGEAMAEPDWTLAQQAVGRCDLLIQVGCSVEVYPAAQIPRDARAAGAAVITVDPQGGAGDIVLRGKAGTILPELVAAAFGEGRGMGEEG